MKQLVVNIENPCNQAWEGMNPVEGGRHCNSCKKTVVDITGMSNKEILALFKKAGQGGVCINALPHQLGEPLNPPVRKKKSVFAVILATILGITSPRLVIAQKAKMEQPSSVCRPGRTISMGLIDTFMTPPLIASALPVFKELDTVYVRASNLVSSVRGTGSFCSRGNANMDAKIGKGGFGIELPKAWVRKPVIYPNPVAAGNEISVSLPRPGAIKINVIDAQGKFIIGYQFNPKFDGESVKLQLPGFLSAGVYHLLMGKESYAFTVIN